MKLKRVIDANQQYADLAEVALSARAGGERPNLGVLLEQVSETFAQALGLREPRGAMISEVARGGVAEQAGLRRGDVILRIDSKIIGDVGHFDRMLASAAAGEIVNLDVWRIRGRGVDAFTVKVALPAGGRAQPILRSIENRTLKLEAARQEIDRYNETARAAIEKMGR